MSQHKSDRSFDGLVGHFKKNIYDTPKGQIRLDILWRDLNEAIPALTAGKPLRILDAGAGMGHLAGQLADLGHELVLCDISADILQQAEQHLQQHHPHASYRLINTALQELAKHTDEQYDVVLFHAVLEWLADPQSGLQCVFRFIADDGYLSLMYYNRHSLVYRHLLNANFSVLKDNQPRTGERLVPISPLEPHRVRQWLMDAGMSIVCESGVRVIYDYLGQQQKQHLNLDELLEMERRYSRLQPYADLARYQHVIVKPKQ